MKKLLLVTGSKATAAVLTAQLDEHLAGKVEVQAIWIDGTAPEVLKKVLETEAVLLLSSAIAKAELVEAGLLAPDRACIVGKRTIDPDRLDALVGLAPGTKALFVNDRRETAEDCVESMRSLGLEGIDWLAWYPALPPPPPEYRIALVAGESSLVPSGIDRCIDIGARIFDFGTLSEIFHELGLPGSEIGLFSRRYLSKILNLAQRLARSDEESRKHARHLVSVIDSMKNGILVFDDKDRISVCNEEARALLSVRPGKVLGSSLASVVRNPEILEFLQCRCGEDEAEMQSQDNRILVRRFDLGDGRHTVATMRDITEVEAETARLNREYRRRGHVAKWTFADIRGESEGIRRAKRIAERLAKTDLSILIYGESGTGKELFASAIHAASSRANGPFLAVDLGALSDDLIESELFGYEEGAFTGAKKGGKAGLFELADGGTIFLDEIANISPKVQQRLLRVLQEKEIMRVGSAEIKRVDVRVIAATNEDLYALASRGQFREDLYFRLKMGFLRIPPLRERRSDIPSLIEYFLRMDSQEEVEIDPELLAVLAERPWHGNVRELRNTITYLLAVRDGSRIGLEELPDSGYFEANSIPADGGLSIDGQGAAGSGTAGSGITPQGGQLAGGGGAADPFDSLDRSIIAVIHELVSRGSTAGRGAIAEALAKRGFVCGAGTVRARLEKLAAMGFVSSSRGRSGTRVTDQGQIRFGLKKA